MQKILLAIDDTDNLESKGTGWLARKMAKELCQKYNGTIFGVTRHQLFLHPEIPYTSHNSSACLELNFDTFDEEIFTWAAEFIQNLSAEGSDPGLCIATENISDSIKNFGIMAQKTVLSMEEAYSLANENSIYLRELGGNGQGVIGALAAVGLKATGNDGRYIELPGIRELIGTMTVEDIINNSGVKAVIDIEGNYLSSSEIVDTQSWIRPRLYAHQPVVVVKRYQQYWVPADKSKGSGEKWKI